MTLEILTSDLLAPMRHGFFTRRGGASSGVFRGLNCGAGSTDQRDIVAINRGRAAMAMGVPAAQLRSLHQVHSPRVVVADDTPPETPPQADALVTATPGIAIAVLTADCMPVLFADRAAGVVGAAHAGWKGAVGGVLEATIDAMERLGARRGDIAAVIGPCISVEAYEVGPELRAAFVAEDPAAERFFTPARGDRLMLDLPAFGLARLRAAGIERARWTRHCTYADPSRFFSYRRATHRREADYGRLLSAIRAG
ncbi:peptidoglycan editing factor PgeF [Palleronia sediminis]|uniref:Purine nucleoside phosphorylase n=1 Tax=Palleronia sediminis TaxID=2547833 RepID=A0A4R6AKJ5_9RHOB|nr:peptidoglycan editing factor PgeF [Palleronia sediminis]TDL82003.1 peptidoglycan editing factor PgeF [Palleronia sediminis]